MIIILLNLLALTSSVIIPKGIRSYSTVPSLDPSKQPLNEKVELDPLFLTRFIDAEGCFSVNIFNN